MRTSRFVLISMVACSVATFFVATADAQPPGGGRGQGGGRQRGGFGQRGGPGGGPGGGRVPTISRAMLLSSDDVKDELKIDDGQDATIAAALEAYRQERDDSRPDRSDFEGLSDDERNELFSKLQKEREALSKKTDDVLNALLEPEQVTRLDQITVQVQMQVGLIGMLKSDDMRKKLTVTDEQVAKLEETEKDAQEAQREMFDQMRAAFRGGGGDNGGERPDFRGMMEKMRKDVQEKAVAVLTDDQKSKLDEMKGEPFSMDMRSLFSRGRGGPGGGDRRGGRDGEGGRRRGDGGGDRDRNRDDNRRRPASDSDDAV